jgi:ribosomal protein L7/L12
MSKVQRSTDIFEMIAERAIILIGSALVLFAIGGVLFRYRGEGTFTPLSLLLMGFGLILLIAAVVAISKVRHVKIVPLTCPFCATVNELTDVPNEDVDCVSCHRMIPIKDGDVMPVMQVRCGFCQALNYYSDKTEVLLCESCNHEIPIMVGHDGPTKKLPKGYAVTEDESVYELVLTDPGKNTEDVISTLQRMLALNRNQVKDILDNLPQTLLTGINRRKAEMLQAQVTVHGASAEIRELSV